MQPSQQVLIHGTAGGMGNLTVQFAQAKRVYIIGKASPCNFGFLRELGADEVLHYKNQVFKNLADSIDLVFNASAVRSSETRIQMQCRIKRRKRKPCFDLILILPGPAKTSHIAFQLRPECGEISIAVTSVTLNPAKCQVSFTGLKVKQVEMRYEENRYLYAFN